MTNKIITISREFGSGGRTIGKKLGEALNIPCYDQELISRIAEESGFASEYIKEAGEYTNGGWFSSILSSHDSIGHSVQDDVWIAQYKIIQKLAQEGPCIIVGRCADYILKDEENVSLLKVFIHADTEARAKRIVEQYGEREDSPKKRLKDKDKRRAAYYQYYTDIKWGDINNYDIVLNSTTFGIDQCVEILKGLY